MSASLSEIMQNNDLAFRFMFCRPKRFFCRELTFVIPWTFGQEVALFFALSYIKSQLPIFCFVKWHYCQEIMYHVLIVLRNAATFLHNIWRIAIRILDKLTQNMFSSQSGGIGIWSNQERHEVLRFLVKISVFWHPILMFLWTCMGVILSSTR